MKKSTTEFEMNDDQEQLIDKTPTKIIRGSSDNPEDT